MNRRFGYPQLIVALIIGLVLGIAATRFPTPQHHRDRETFEECLVTICRDFFRPRLRRS